MAKKTLGEKQRIFTKLLAELVLWAYGMGYELTYSEAYRTPEMAAIYARAGKGIRNSLHTQRLAVDFNLFVEGVYKTRSEDHRKIGEMWESLGPGHGVKTCWGGRFGDGNHYSIEHNGVK